MDTPLNLLIIEDTLADFLLIERHLQRHGLNARCRQVSTLAGLTKALQDQAWDLVLSDFNIPDMVFTETLALLRARLPEVPVILVSGMVGEEKAVGLLKLGVTDFLLKENMTRLVPAIQRAQQEAAQLLVRRSAEQALREKDQLLREISTLAHIGGWEIDTKTARFSWTEELARIHAVDPALEVTLAFLFSFYQGHWRQKMEMAMQMAQEHGAPFDLEPEIISLQGQHKWLRVVFVAAPEEGLGRARKIRGSMQDISARKRSEMMLFEQMERARVTLHSIGDAVVTTDAQGNIDYLNPVAQQLSGWSTQEALHRPLMQVLHLIDANTGLALENTSLLSDSNTYQLPAACRLIRKDGKCSDIENSATPILARDGSIIGSVLVLRDVTAAREATAKIEYQATHDALTNLPNRILAWDRLEQAIAAAKRDDTYIGVMFLDLDRFKLINDSLGHSAGDFILEQVAKRLKAAIRAVDTVGRQGGDEFIIIIPGARKRIHFVELAQKILNAVSRPYVFNRQELRMTFSIGISVYPQDGAAAEQLVKNADAAMYFAKESGRDNYQFYSAEMNHLAAQRLSFEMQLRHAMEQHEFVIHYQPKVDAIHRKLIGAEALIRWNHPQSGLLAPDNFIRIAEESGLIVPIGQWVMNEVCRQNKAWLQQGFACVPISVNLSALQFCNKFLVESLQTLLHDTGLPPALLELELTESFIMRDTEAVLHTLCKLKELGLTLSIDDFGTGYSSLSYLTRFPIDTLKIDQAFVRGLNDKGNNAAIIKAIISMAHSLQMTAIAEGVENREQCTFLETHHCDEMQGFYFSEPVPAIEFEAMLMAGFCGHGEAGSH